jgi:hypothetical protein
MSENVANDIVVTVPKDRWLEWIDEGDLPGEPWNGVDEWSFYLGGTPPPFVSSVPEGARLYVVAHGKLRGFAPIVRVAMIDYRAFEIVRRNDAVAVTIAEPIRGFQGWRYRWWERRHERPFPEWRTP